MAFIMPNTDAKPLTNHTQMKEAEPSKRFACDRCRAHKLRCLRENAGQTPCRRCYRARVECVSSPPLRAGRRRTLDPGPSRSKDGGNVGDTKPLKMEPLTAPVEIRNPTQLAAEETKPLRRATTLPDVSQEGFSWQLQYLDQINSNQVSLPYWEEDTYSATPPTFSNFPLDELMGVQMGSNGVASSTTSTSSQYDIPLYPTIPTPPTQIFDPPSHFVDQQEQTPIHNDVPPELSYSSETSNRQSPKHPQDFQERDRVQQLSDFAQHLYQQFTTLQTDSWSTSDLSNDGEATKALSNITSSSEYFHEIINDLKKQHNSSDTTDSMLGMQIDSPEPTSPHRLETSTLLLVITCYIRLISIYSALFSQILTHLTPIPATKPSGLSLQYRNLQLTILIEVSVHMISRLEVALGIPSKYKLQSESTDQFEEGSGILGDDASLCLLEAALTLSENDSGEGKGGVRSLWMDIMHVKRLLNCSDMQPTPFTMHV